MLVNQSVLIIFSLLFQPDWIGCTFGYCCGIKEMDVFMCQEGEEGTLIYDECFLTSIFGIKVLTILGLAAVQKEQGVTLRNT